MLPATMNAIAKSNPTATNITPPAASRRQATMALAKKSKPGKAFGELSKIPVSPRSGAPETSMKSVHQTAQTEANARAQYRIHISR